MRAKTKVKTEREAALDVKRIYATALRSRMAAKKISVAQFAKDTKTGRESIRRLLNPKNTAITLNTMARYAAALDLELAFQVRQLPLAQINDLTGRLATAKTQAEADALKKQILEGYYGKPIDQLQHYAEAQAG